MNPPLLKFDHSHNHTQTLTPRLQFAVRLLQLSALDYEQELHALMAKNPFLELDESAPARHADSGDFDPADPPTATQPVDRDNDPGHSAEDAPAWDRHEQHEPSQHGDDSTQGEQGESRELGEPWSQSAGPSRDGAANPSQMSATDLMVSHGDLRHHLQGQVNLLRLSPRDRALACSVVDSLDEDGYCRVDLAEMMAAAALEPAVDASEIGMALHLVQSLDPCGVGARSVGECLLLQLEKVDAAHRDTARHIVTDHIDRLAQRDVPGLAKLLRLPLAEIDAACVALRRLDPRPGWRFSRPDTRYVTPDVMVRKRRGVWTAQLNGDVVPRLRLNRLYADLFQRHREASHGELGAHLQEARWTIRNVEQRFATILDVAQAILRRQHLFFEHGPLAMKPLALRDIAEELGIHESTVCRVTNNKYMATPGGLFELKHFFSRAMPMASGGACSATAIRSVLQELIDAEDPAAPLSDVDIAQRLARQGLTVARRTVTKYRQALKIAPADRRRSHATSRATGSRLAA